MHKDFHENFSQTLAGKIEARLTGAAGKVTLDIRNEVTSTNDIAKALAKEPSRVREGYTVIASAQTQGRGTSGRSFYSPPGSGIYLSTVLRPGIPVHDLCHITPLCAVAAAEALEAVSRRPCRIKWINDIFVAGKKVCGILTEGSVSGAGLDYAVVGIGVNVAPAAFPEALRDTAGSLFEEAPADLLTAKADLAAGILNRLFALLPDIGSRRYLEDYRRRSLLLGRRVTVRTDDHAVLSGIAEGIDEHAFLCVKPDDGHLITIKSSAQLLAYSL